MSEIIISSGVTSTGLVADSGDVIIIEAGGTLVDGVINDGGALKGVYGAVAENLTAATGATVELSEGAKTSGLMLTGANTNIAEGTLYYMGAAVTGTVTNGTLSNLGGAYRVCIGDGITASDPVVGGETVVGVRVYAQENAIVSGGSITTSGNLGLLDTAYGNGVTVGGEGVTKATYNTFDNATADNTIVNAGGNFQIRNEANNTTVNSGGIFNVSNGGIANGVTVNSGGTVSVLNGGRADGGRVEKGGYLSINNGGVVNGMDIELDRGKVNVSGGTISGGIIRAATNEDGSTNYVFMSGGAHLRGVTLTTDEIVSSNHINWVRLGWSNENNTGYADDVTVRNFACLDVNNGSGADINVYDGGKLFVHGRYSTTVRNVVASGARGGSGAVITGQNGAVFNHVTISSGGIIKLSDDTTAAYDLEVKEGGKLFVAGGTTSGAIISGATITPTSATGDDNVVRATINDMTILNGAETNYIRFDQSKMSNITVHGGSVGDSLSVNFSFYNTINNLTITTDADSYDANTCNVQMGGNGANHINGLTVENYSYLNFLRGTISDATISAGAQVVISSLASADGVLVSGGKLYISGATVKNADIRLGGSTLYMSKGTLSGANLTAQKGNTAYVEMSGGGLLRDVTLTGSGTVANAARIRIGWKGTATPTLENVTARSYAYLQCVKANGSNVDVLDGSYLSLQGGTIEDVTFSGYKYRRASGTVSNATLDTVMIGSGAQVTISGGGVVRDVTVNKDGILTVSANGVATLAWLPETWSGAVTRMGDETDVTQLDRDKMVYYGGETVGLIEKADEMTDLTVATGNSALIYDNGVITNATVNNGANVYVNNGGVVSGATVSNGGVAVVSDGATMNDVQVKSGAEVAIMEGGVVSGALVSSGAAMEIVSGAKIFDVAVNKDAELTVQGGGTATVVFNPWSGTVTSNEGATVEYLDRDKKVYYGNDSLGLLSKTDVLDDLHIKTRYYKVNVYDGGIANNVRVDNYSYINVYSGGTGNDGLLSNGYMSAAPGAVVNGLTVRGGGAFVWFSGAVLKDVYLSGGSLSLYGSGAVTNANVYNGAEARIYGGTCNSTTIGGFFGASAATAVMRDTVISSGGSMYIYNIGTHTDTTVKAGGQIDIRTTNLGKTARGTFTIDFTGAEGQDIYTFTSRTIADAFNNLSVNAEVVVKASEKQGDYSYNILYKGGQYNNAFVLDLGDGVTYATGKDTGAIINPFTGMQYERTSNAYVSSGATLYDLRLVTMQTAHVITAVDTAAALATSGSTLNGSDREARWTENTTCGDTVYAAEGMTTGNAWLDIDGANVDKALYGAAANQNFAGVVNMKLTDGSIRNLAAGAAAGGSVKAVNFRMTGGELAGNAYLGGMGDVTEAVTATVESGELAAGKNLYAGALWNYKNQTGATSVGSVNLTVKAGTIKGNVYGASAVKTGTITTTAATDARHTVGDVTLTLAGGTAANAEFCAFAGGYATGTDSAKLASVYDVANVTATITGGTWGDAADARGGRGVFGGVFASGVKATARNVSITVEAGTVANVFGGGWAQKGGESTVENVSIVVTGGTVANIFGCGIHSVSVSENGASTTSVGDVSITLAGGNVTDNVYARGLIDGDAVTGDVTVTVTGSADYGCNFHGFSRTAGEDDKAELVFADYSGTISGEVNGFKEIALSGDTAMTFTSTDISNTAWLFDATERTDAGSVFATGTTVDFSNATVTLNLAEEAVRSDWSIFAGGADTAYDKFDVQIGGISILPDTLELGEQIASGDYAGWGFTVEDTVLKFKNLA